MSIEDSQWLPEHGLDFYLGESKQLMVSRMWAAGQIRVMVPRGIHGQEHSSMHCAAF